MSSPLNYGTPSSRLGVGTPRTPGAVGTPIRPRPDVRSERKMRTVNVGGGSEPVSRRILKSGLFIANSQWFHEEYENLKDMIGLWCMVKIEKVFLL